MDGQTIRASLVPAELKRMVDSIRNIEVALGDGIKKPNKSEEANAKVVQKSILAKRPIKKERIMTERHPDCQESG